MDVDLRALAGTRLLLAEDETLIAMFLARVLKNEGAEVTTVASVQEGLEVADGAYDCALLDVSLRDGEVFPLADDLHFRGIPLVFHTGHGHAHAALNAYGNPPKALEKPAHKTEILSILFDTMMTAATETPEKATL